MHKVILIITSLFSLQLSAQDLVTLGPSTFQGAEGAIAVNIAAGEHNVQSSNFVYSAQGDYELTIISSSQSSEIASSASASIESGAFDNAGGYISANLAAGNSNQQHNIIIFAPSSEVSWEVADLSSQSAAISDRGYSEKGDDLSVDIAPLALNGASGVIQMSQIAGSGNTVRNTFQMPTTIN
ncbi:hypothetical protein [Vibrio brasiliensis]|uniref:Uncharacterized protein n=1 Tax=Vibrio brasiliensis LMG 20546 TaxID=945543 RepID=E8LXL7_9VIBR|nr:hypothetical protein [Vibrio brasiliensis]EGA64628.1 hypothetical protein VIBR0546_07147 [Vibrio brasiliensis LMG 20546]